MSIADFLIMTPLDEEWRSVAPILRKKRKRKALGPVTYYLWNSTPRNKQEPTEAYLICAASMGAMGLVRAANFSREAIGNWDPVNIVLLGIAGSLCDHLELGDVIVSTEVFGYDLAAVESVSGNNREFKFDFRPSGYQGGALLLDRARSIRNEPAVYKRWQNMCLEAAQKEQELGPEDKNRTPSLHFEITASGNNVVKSTAFGNELKRQIHSKICAVEMEAKGLFQAVHEYESTSKLMVIRGISDSADENKQELEKASRNAWRRLSAGNAARLLKLLMERRPIDPSPGVVLNLTLDEPELLLRERLFLRKSGSANFVFQDIFEGLDSLPDINLEVTAFQDRERKLLPINALCLIERKDEVERLKPTESFKRDKLINFAIARRRRPVIVSLLLAYDTYITKIEIKYKDEFGRVANGCWVPPPKLHEE